VTDDIPDIVILAEPITLTSSESWLTGSSKTW
jgi:hypothetical protein